MSVVATDQSSESHYLISSAPKVTTLVSCTSKYYTTATRTWFQRNKANKWEVLKAYLEFFKSQPHVTSCTNAPD